MSIPERLKSLRAKMEEKGIDVYIIPTADFHQSEYVGEYFKARSYITGFTGSAGTAVVTKDEARLWTDARYFIQAANQLKDTTVQLMKMYVPGEQSLTEYLDEILKPGDTLGFDGRVVSVGEGQEYEEVAKKKQAKVVYHEDLISMIWEDRPELSKKSAFSLGIEYAGESAADKLKRVREAMEKAGANVHVLTTLDDICWILNIRGDDIDFFPLVLSYAIIKMDCMELYVDESKLNDEIKAQLAELNVHIHPYNDIYEDIKGLEDDCVALIDPDKLNYALYNNIPETVKKVEEQNPSILMKAIKNPVEVANIRKA